jgi:hypothetical protein
MENAETRSKDIEGIQRISRDAKRWQVKSINQSMQVLFWVLDDCLIWAEIKKNEHKYILVKDWALQRILNHGKNLTLSNLLTYITQAKK